MTPFVAYYRVSTARQGQSGLGQDAQRRAVADFIHHRGELLAEFEEIESGRKNDRPELTKALDLCRRRKATLVIAKLDRLARNVAFISALSNGIGTGPRIGFQSGPHRERGVTPLVSPAERVGVAQPG